MFPFISRLMIDWLFSLAGARRRLRSMITQIDSLIEGDSKQSASGEGPQDSVTASPALHIIIATACCAHRDISSQSQPLRCVPSTVQIRGGASLLGNEAACYM